MPEERKERTSGGAQAGAGRAAGGRKRRTGDVGDGPTGRGDGPAKAGARRGGRRAGSDLRSELREFVAARPSGWSHEDWLQFLEELRERGHNVHDRDAIGMALEKERLDLALSKIKGVGPQRRTALVERFDNVWTLRHASVEEIAERGNLPRSLAQRVREELR